MQKIFFRFIIISILGLSSCSTCEDINLGNVSPPSYVFDFSVYEHGESLSFANDQGDSYMFTVNFINMPGRLNLTEIGTTSDFQNGSYSCYEYKSLYTPLIQLEDRSERNTLQLQFLAFGESEASLEYIIDIAGGWNDQIDGSQEVISGWAQKRYNMTTGQFDPRQDDTFSAERLDNWSANGLSYDNVLRISSDDNDLYFHPTTGFVGFTRKDGDLYTLNP